MKTPCLTRIAEAIESEVVQSYLSKNIDDLITECESVIQTNCGWQEYRIADLIIEQAREIRDRYKQEDTDEG